MSYEMVGGYGSIGSLGAIDPCMGAGASWCWNPLVMHIKQRYPRVLEDGSVSQIRDTFKKALKSDGRIPTSNLDALKTPTRAVADAVAAYRGAFKTQLPYETLWPDAVLANMEAMGGLQVKIPPAPMPMQEVIAPTAARKPRIVLTLPGPSAEPAGATAEGLVVGEKKIPWLYIGAGALVLVGGVALLLRR